MTAEYGGFCTLCGEKIPSFEGLSRCPRCGSDDKPCSYDDQVTVSVNVHELRVLCIWAENWANETDGVNVDVVYAIARRLHGQLGERAAPLTMADEFRELKDSGYDFETDHPSAERAE